LSQSNLIPKEERRVNRLVSDFYRSPSANRVAARLEDQLLSADDSWWTGRDPLHARVVAEVPRAVYLNFLARKSYVAALTPHLFKPLDLPSDRSGTLFTIVLFIMERARPVWAQNVWCSRPAHHAIQLEILRSNNGA